MLCHVTILICWCSHQSSHQHPRLAAAGSQESEAFTLSPHALKKETEPQHNNADQTHQSATCIHRGVHRRLHYYCGTAYYHYTLNCSHYCTKHFKEQRRGYRATQQPQLRERHKSVVRTEFPRSSHGHSCQSKQLSLAPSRPWPTPRNLTDSTISIHGLLSILTTGLDCAATI